MQPDDFDNADDGDVDEAVEDAVEEAAEEVAQDARTDADERAGESWSPRPSQDKLHEDQLDVLATFVQEGYPSRRAFLEGLHDIIWHSLGRLHGNWYAELGRDDTVLSVVITDEEKRRRYRDRPVDQDVATRTRRRLAKKVIRPAFRAAFREMRANADEHVLEDERTHPDHSSMFAMRPSMEFLQQRQEDRLRELLDGFADRSELDEWLHRLDDVTLGQIERVDADFDWRIEMQSVAQRALLGDRYEDVRQRETFAAFYVLPAMSYTPQLLLDRAKELREEDDTGPMSPTQL